MDGTAQFRFRHSDERTERRRKHYTATAIALLVVGPIILKNYPPGIEIAAPAAQQVVLGDSITISGTVANTRIDSVRVSDSQTSQEIPLGSDHKFNVKVPVRPGW